MVSFSKFNDGRWVHPTTPETRELRIVIQDLMNEVIYTRTRFGRKPQWKKDQMIKFIETLLEGKSPVDTIAISRTITNDRCINGNNRMRAILSFAKNEFGIEAEDAEGHKTIYYYNSIPESERVKNHRGKTLAVLPPTVKSMFDRYPIHMNMRRNLTEQDEAEWYKLMNTNMKAHNAGQILVTTLCVPDETSQPFVESLLKKFPQLKSRIGDPETADDIQQPGYILADLFDTDIDPNAEDDKDEYVLRAIATLHNIIVNGLPYKDVFRGEYSHETAESNYRLFMQVFAGIHFTDEVIGFFKEPPSSKKKSIGLIWTPGFLLGAIAWSIANEKEGAVQIWREFLSNLTLERLKTYWGKKEEGQTQDDLSDHQKYMESIRHEGDQSSKKYEKLWDIVRNSI